ncbi:hypothetical protein [Sphingosinicella sp.]|uniref:hypothetical protein n=1 Tax=Sphingosinicella sp. TaxID=1917971 RepID=UPI0035B12F5C
MTIELRFAEHRDILSRDMAVHVWTRRLREAVLSVKRVRHAWISLIEAGFKQGGCFEGAVHTLMRCGA